ncbi:ribonuclease D [Desulfuromonas sp. KJ2020]|uniref:ribonuclease D n=1 Tax=Desulfuromonas sp. KJ2020 TaxID=2919173 RepID=UPI0020A810E4|nr:ribonuclease D [Desulfuromonas sp. KJ2020]MCP3176326.1 ribonuclease D [Desulfuromonas sp. KJ2020]
MIVATDRIEIITTAPALAAFAQKLAGQSSIAVDLEADSMHSYREKVCLLQFTTEDETVLVDPLAVTDLAPLGPVLANPKIRKIFHAADYDIRCLYRDFSLEINGLFDTMIACQFLGEEKVGLADVLLKYFGIELDKQYQRADWSKRPLSPEMIRYAAEDTAHLHRLVVILEEALQEKGRLTWVQEEWRLLEKVRHSEPGGALFLRLKGAGALPRRSLAVLEALLQWRDREAQRRDCPHFKVLGNKSLLQLARTMPHSLQGLVGIEGISPRVVDRYGKSLLAAVEVGKAVPEGELPSFPRTERRVRDEKVDQRLTHLKAWRAEKAAELQMDPGIVINNALLEEIAWREPHNEEALRQIPGLKNWQGEVLAEGLLRTLAGA